MLIKNLKEIISEETLSEKYFICDFEQAQKFSLHGIEPISIDENHKYTFIKTELLMKILKEGGGQPNE